MNDNTVISTRVRLARNISGYPFPSKLTSEAEAKEIVRKVNTIASKLGSYNLYFMNSITDSMAISLKEKYLISNDLIANHRFGAALINKDEDISIMINEEDHIRGQCFMRGLNLKEAYRRINEIDDKLSTTMTFAFDKELGYITACPTNLGTGLRASVMLFLPALSQKKYMTEIIREVSRLGLTVRGIYGEGSDADGYMYQISNEVTLGVSEEKIISIVEDAVNKIVIVENKTRNEMNLTDPIGIKDMTKRSFGILTNCAKISSKEFLQQIANVKLGISLGYIKFKEPMVLDDLIVAVRPANINLLSGKELIAVERDIYRAEYVNQILRKNIVI
jgi:protein arginine kinase